MDTRDKAPGSEIKFIVTPGLYHYFRDFLLLCEAAEDSPIMIMGPTGAGKSLFLHLFSKLVTNKIKAENKKTKVEWANCSHFGGRASDPNIARSELFGHIKGSHGGALKDKVGMIELADGGAMILEEIGELPPEVQAMLLTFVETGEYRPVGANEAKRAKVRLIGATNNEEALREDFRYRFIPFFIPHLHERRQDVLYYLADKYPELAMTLTPSEVIELFAYNWPGNVREIDRVAKLLKFHKLRGETLPFQDPDRHERYNRQRMADLDKRQTKLGGFTMDLYNALEGWGADVQLLESLLNKHGIGLSNDNQELAFKKNDIGSKPEKSNEDLLFENQYSVQIIPPTNAFEDSFYGYMGFCALFMQDPHGNYNILENLEKDNPDYFNFDLKKLIDEGTEEAELIKLAKKVMQYLKKTEVPEEVDYFMPQDLGEYWSELTENPEFRNQEPGKDIPHSITKIFTMKENELLKHYYDGLLKICGGNVAAVSRKAGLKLTTLRSSFDRLGIVYRKR